VVVYSGFSSLQLRERERKRRREKYKFISSKMQLEEGMKIELQKDISQVNLQVIYCRLFAGIVKVV